MVTLVQFTYDIETIYFAMQCSAQSREWVDGSWVMGQMGHENRTGHMGHGSLGVDPRPISFLKLYGWAYILC